jgi:hypothetical protein
MAKVALSEDRDYGRAIRGRRRTSCSVPHRPPEYRIDFAKPCFDTGAMGVRTRGLDITAAAAMLKADRAAREEAGAVVDRWNRRLATGRDTLWSPTIRAALLAGTSRAIDLRTLDRHSLASVGTLVLGLRCSWCPGSAPMPKLLGLYALPQIAAAKVKVRDG